MVASKSTKVKVRLTYAERVLGAFSLAQKESRRNAIHIATIRAQVKKTAQNRKDKLGPQWSSWVGRTINALTDQGLLEHGDTNGRISLTPCGKKAYAHKTLELGADAVASPAQEDAIWKQMTKAELKNELKVLQKAHNEASNSEKTTEELREDLAERQNEIDRVRDELAELRRQLAGDKAEHMDFNASSSQPGTPGIQIDLASSPPPPSSPLAGPSRLAKPGVTRTQSGSHISQLSKQPTPAPSDEGGDMDYMNDGVFGSAPLDFGAQTNNQLPLPTSTGPALTLNKDSGEVNKYKVMYQEAKHAEQVAEEKATSMEATLSGQVSVIAKRDELVQVLRQESATMDVQLKAATSAQGDLAGCLDAAEASKFFLQEQLKAATDEASTLSSSLDTITAEWNAALLTAEELRMRLKAAVTSSERLTEVVSELEKDKVQLTGAIEEHTAAFANAHAALRESQTTIKVLTSNIVEKNTAFSSLTNQLAKSNDSVLHLVQEVERLKTVDAAFQDEKAQNLTLDNTVKELTAKNNASRVATEDFQSALAVSTADIGYLAGQKTEANQAYDALATQLRSSESQFAASSGEVTTLRLSLLAIEGHSKSLEDQLLAANARTQSAELTVSQLELAKAVGERTIEALKAGVISFKREQMAALEQLESSMISTSETSTAMTEELSPVAF